MITVAVLPGDGIGREVVDGPLEILRGLQDRGVLEVSGPWPVGLSAFGDHGTVLPERTLAACEEADAVLLGAIGEHPGADPGAAQQPSALLALRSHFDLRVSIREVTREDGAPLVVVRNLLGGAYGPPSHRHESGGTGPAWDRVELGVEQVRELASIACDLLGRFAGHHLVSADKANLFATSRLWRRTVGEAAAARGVDVRHAYVDRMAFELVRELPPAVILTEGIFGDILSDVAAARAGSVAFCSSASVNPGPAPGQRCRALFEPLHGSAPRRAGQDVVNPTGGYLALAAALAWFDETRPHSEVVRGAVARALGGERLTYDIARPPVPPVSTSTFSALVNAHVRSSLPTPEKESP